MIYLEDRELEEMVLSGKSCIAVPIEIYVPENGEAQITTYSCFYKIAEEFERLFKNDLLSEEALNWLDQKIYTDVKMFGYEHSFDDIHMMSEYSMNSIDQLCKFKNDDVFLIKSESDIYLYDNSLIVGISIDKEAAVVIKDNKLVSISCINDVSFDDGSVEIYVETDAEYRNKGYGAAAVSLIAEKYLNKGITVRYKCAKNNIASIKLSEKCGFIKNGEKYSYVCFAIENN